MTWQLTQVSDVGTSNPIVARLLPGLQEIIQMAQPPKEKKALFRKVASKSKLHLFKPRSPFIEEIQTIDQRLANEGVKTQSEGRVIETPGVHGKKSAQFKPGGVQPICPETDSRIKAATSDEFLRSICTYSTHR